MNKRIKELYEQSFLTDDYVNVGINGVELGIKFDPEKFAELIIRECMSQIEEVRQIKAGNAGPVYTQGFEDGMFVAIRTIEELAEQAGIDEWWDSGSERREVLQEHLEKLAELIVEECVEVAHPKLTDVGEWAAVMRLVQKRLKQHFGVE